VKGKDPFWQAKAVERESNSSLETVAVGVAKTSATMTA
jgi:hypothetical protein